MGLIGNEIGVNWGGGKGGKGPGGKTGNVEPVRPVWELGRGEQKNGN